MSNKYTKLEFYSILDVPQNASSADIRSAYLKLSKLYHPDKGRFSPKASHEKFVKLNEAYETLIDPTRRMKYDRRVPPHGPDQTAKKPEEKETPNHGFSLQQKFVLTTIDHLGVAWDNLSYAFHRFNKFRMKTKGNLFGFTLNHDDDKLKLAIAREHANLSSWRTRVAMVVYYDSAPNVVDEFTELFSRHKKLQKWIASLTMALNGTLSQYQTLQRCRSWAGKVQNPVINYKLQHAETKFKGMMKKYLDWNKNEFAGNF